MWTSQRQLISMRPMSVFSKAALLDLKVAAQITLITTITVLLIVPIQSAPAILLVMNSHQAMDHMNTVALTVPIMTITASQIVVTLSAQQTPLVRNSRLPNLPLQKNRLRALQVLNSS